MGWKFNPFTGKLDISGGGASGPAGGDLTGTYPNPTVDGLQGRPVSNATPVNGQVLQYDGTNWVPGSIPSGGSGGGGIVYYLNFNTAADDPLTNIPQTPNASKELGIVGDVTGTPYLSPILSTASYDFLASFVTDVSTPSATAIPAGIWDFNLFVESTTTNSANQIYFKVEILKYDGTNAPTLLATSNDTYIYDPAEINQYIASVVMPQTTILLTDRIVVYLYGRAHQNNNRLTFHFGGSYPSHTHSTMPSVTGTGVVKVVNGVFQSPASTIVDSDVSATANIAQSKISNLTSDLSGKVAKAGDTMTGKLNIPASTITQANLNLATGFDPTLPTAGDIWTNSNDLKYRSTSQGSITVAALNRTNNFTGTQIINGPATSTPILSVTNTSNVSSSRAASFTANGNVESAVLITQNGNGGGLKIVNPSGTGESLRIEDESPETTPFVVSAIGKVGIGVNPDTTVGLKLDSTGVQFALDGSVQKVAMQPYTVFEHFLQGNLSLNNLRNLTGNGGSSSSAVPARTYNSTGVVTVVTGTSAAVAFSAMGIDQTGENAIDLSNAPRNIFSSRSAFFQLPNATATGIWYSGFVDSYNSTSSNGAYFRIVNNGNLEAVVVAAGGETAQDLGFRPATGSMNLYEVEVNTSGLVHYFFYYNGNLVNSQLGVTPAPGRVNYATGIVRTSTTTTTSLEFDLDLVFARLYNTGFTLRY